MYRRSLAYSILDGVFWSVMVGFGETYFLPYAVSLKASELIVGLVVSLPLLVGALGQFTTSWLLNLFGARKPLVRTGVLIQALSYLPIIAIPYITGNRPILLLVCVGLYGLINQVINPPWQSWMGDIVPVDTRGRYFGRRNLWIHLTTLFSMIAAGYLLHHHGFAVIFLIAAAGRLISFYFLGRQEEPPYHSPAEAQFTFWEFVKRMRFNNYGLFVIFIGLMMFGVALAGPYITAYQLEDLHFTYMEFMIAQAAFVAVKLLFLPVWGHYSDRYGSRKLLSLSGYLLPVIPILWMLTKDFKMILIIQGFSGFVWAGFELCTFNFILDCTTPEKRARCAAYHQVFSGLGIVLGALAGGLLIQQTTFLAVPAFFVFFLSGVVRLVVAAGFLPRIRDLRAVEPISYRALLARMFLFLKPTGGTSGNA